MLINIKNLSVISSMILFLLFSATSLVLADISLPTAKGIQVQTLHDYPDFDFYYSSIPTKRTYGPNGGTEIFYDKLQLTPVKFFSPDNPYDVPVQGYSEANYFLAVKKNSEAKNDSELKNKIISALKKETSAEIYFFYLNDQVENNSDDGKIYVVYTVESINETGIKTNRRYDDKISFRLGKTAYLIIGLALTAVFIALGIIFIKKLKNT